MKEKLKKIVENYLGTAVKEIKTYRDPLSPGYIAIRVIYPDNCTHDLLYDSNAGDEDDRIEEVEFETWPPKSDASNMWKAENVKVSM